MFRKEYALVTFKELPCTHIFDTNGGFVFYREDKRIKTHMFEYDYTLGFTNENPEDSRYHDIKLYRKLDFSHYGQFMKYFLYFNFCGFNLREIKKMTVEKIDVLDVRDYFFFETKKHKKSFDFTKDEDVKFAPEEI